MEKLLILGSDLGTYDLAVEAKNMGIYVIVADLMETSPTKEIADESWYISTTELDELEKRIISNNISGVIAGASEFNMEKVRALTKRLNMPLYCENDSAWNLARNKRKFKDLCISCGVPVAPDFYVEDDMSEEEIANIDFPVVVKPVDASGNRGQSFCNNKEELLAGLEKAHSISENECIIIEKKLVGPEYTGYYVIADGEVALSFYTSMHHQTGESHKLYSIENTTCCDIEQYLIDVDPGIKQVFKKAGCTNGVALIECMYDEDGHFYVLEMGYRLGGPVLYVMNDKISGFNTMRWQIECALGVKHDINSLPEEKYKYKECAASYNLFTKKAGKISSIEGLKEIENLPNVIIDMPKRENSEVRYNVNMGVIRIYGKDIYEVIETIKTVNSTFSILGEDGENIFIKFNDYKTLEKEYLKGLNQVGLD